MPGPSEEENWCILLPCEQGSGGVFWINDDFAMSTSWSGVPNNCWGWVLMLDVLVMFLVKSLRTFTGLFMSSFNGVPVKMGWLHWSWLFELESSAFSWVFSDICIFSELSCDVLAFPCETSAVKPPNPGEENLSVERMLLQTSATLRALC